MVCVNEAHENKLLLMGKSQEFGFNKVDRQELLPTQRRRTIDTNDRRSQGRLKQVFHMSIAFTSNQLGAISEHYEGNGLEYLVLGRKEITVFFIAF